MATIEDRAIQAYYTYTAENTELVRGARMGYIKGATDQRKIDKAISVREFRHFLEDIVCAVPEWKDTIELQRIAWISTFSERIAHE